jgi:uncharacterized protein (TIGR00299 family) protein
VTTLFIDASTGVAGDMLMGALIDAGVPVEVVETALGCLGIDGFSFIAAPVTRGHIAAIKATVTIEDHETERHYPEVERIVAGAPLKQGVKVRALATLRLLGESESKAHAIPLEQVHLHEVGALDSIADVVGACAAIEHLDANRIVTSALRLGSGIAASEHGPLPVPVPAVVNILKGVPVLGGGEHEQTTPTGAALLVANSDSFGEMPSMRLDSVGYGAGDRDTPVPNLTRVFVGTEDATSKDDAVVIEANIDDMSPELLPPLLDSLLAAGAHDAWLTPIVMKKGRPAFSVSALCSRDHSDRIADTLFRESTTFGIRTTHVTKQALERAWAEVQVAGHSVRVKTALRAGSVVTASVEFEDARKAARATGMALKDVYAEALARATEKIPKP